jgi:hypothetical protein
VPRAPVWAKTEISCRQWDFSLVGAGSGRRGPNRATDQTGTRRNCAPLATGIAGRERRPVHASTSITGMENANIEAISLKTGQIKVLQRGGYFGRYLPNGYLLYVHQGTLFGVKFDPDRLETRGTPTTLLEDVADNTATGSGEFDFSTTGTFVYTAEKSAAQVWRIGWLDASGSVKPLLAMPGKYTQPRVSRWAKAEFQR